MKHHTPNTGVSCQREWVYRRQELREKLKGVGVRDHDEGWLEENRG